MKKISVLFTSVITLLLSGCAFDSEVDTFYDMGCSSSFSDIFLTKGTDVSTTYPLKVVMGINCNEDVAVTINFYDNGHPGHYRYFLVNGVSKSYKETIYTDYTGVSSGVYTFTTDDYIYQKGTYYGLYEVTAKNLETGDYTVQEYRIEAYDYHNINGKEPAESNFDANPAQKLYEQVTLSDNMTISNTGRIIY